jgi:4-hydroxymandelate oxidase
MAKDGGMDREYSAAVVGHAEALGFRAIFVTVDTPNTGNREQTFGDPHFVQTLARQRGFPPDRSGLVDVAGPMGPFCSALTWADVEWLATVTSLPLVLKGISSPADAAMAAAAPYIAGIVVSNHGGRNLDGAIGTADALYRCGRAVREIMARNPEARCEVLVDGGVRRGIDLIRAAALGATVGLVGRPVHWGLTLGGQAGVEKMLEMLRDELAISLQLCGCRGLDEVTIDHVWNSASPL